MLLEGVNLSTDYVVELLVVALRNSRRLLFFKKSLCVRQATAFYSLDLCSSYTSRR